MGGVAPSPVHAPSAADRHNAALSAAHRRVEELEQRLADILQPILEQAGARAAAKFTRTATNHLTAALLREGDRQALTRIRPGESFGFRLRPFTLTASAPTPVSAMVCLKPRPGEALTLALPGGEEPETLHVTLVSLGEVEGDLRPVAEALKTVAASHAPLEGVIGGVGRFQPPGVAILLPDVPGLVELRVAVTEALVAADVPYGREHGFEAHLSVDAEPDPETLDEALTRTAQKPVHFDSILIVQGDETVFELPLVGVPPLTASGVCSYCNGVGGLGQAGEVCRDGQLPTMACICTLTAAGGEHVGWTPPAPDELIDIDQLVSTLRTKTDPVRTALVKTAMTPTLKDAGHVFDVTNPLTAKVLAQSGSQIKNIADTTRLNVMRIISRSYHEGLSIPDTAKAIRAGMASASAYRARMIARTELAGAVNGGSLAAAQIADGALGIGLFKVWLTAPGAPHPRHEDYEGLDGQTVGLEDTFDVGGDSLQFPGDPDGSPEETIQCRCALSYTETAPDGSPAAAAATPPGGGVTDEGVSESGDTALQDVMPLTPPPGDTISVGSGAPVPERYLSIIQEHGLDAPLKDLRPTTAAGREVYAKAPTTEGLYKPGGHYMPDGSYHGGAWTEERTAVHDEVEAAHFNGRTPPTLADGEKPTAVFTAGGGASGKGGTMVEIGGRRFPLGDLEDDAARLAGSGKRYDELVAKGDEWAIRGEAKYPDVILINPDVIKEMLPEYSALKDVNDLYAASGVHEESSEIAKTVQRLAAEQRYNVVIDTTGSSGTFPEKIEKLVKQGYDAQVEMVSIPTNEAIVRSIERGEKRGRYVAIQALKGGHRGASAQLEQWKDAKFISKWHLYDNNTEGDRVLVAEGGNGKFVIHDQAKWDEIIAKKDETSMAPGAVTGKTAREAAPVAPPSVASIIPGPSTSVRADVRLKYDTMLAHWRSYAKALDRDYDTLLQDAQTNLAARVKDAPVQIRVRPEALQDIVADGRFKSQFETNTSAGALNPDLRARAERNLFGYKSSLPPEQRPIYGYLGGSSSEAAGPVTQYGNIAVRLKDDVRARTTFTMTDSLTPATEKTIAAVPVEQPSLEAFGSGSYSPTEARPPKPGGTLREISDFYAEAQIHGGVTIDDIAKVFMDRQGMAEELGYLQRTLQDYERNLARLEKQDPQGAYTARVRITVETFKHRISMVENDGAKISAMLDEAGVPNEIVDFAKQF